MFATEEDDFTLAWTAEENPDRWTAELWDTQRGLVATTGQPGTERQTVWGYTRDPDRGYYSRLRATTGGQPGPWAVSDTIAPT